MSTRLCSGCSARRPCAGGRHQAQGVRTRPRPKAGSRGRAHTWGVDARVRGRPERPRPARGTAGPAPAPEGLRLRRPCGRLLGELARAQADSSALSHAREDLLVEAVPAARGPRVEAVRVPENRKAAPVLGRPVEQLRDPIPGSACGQAEVPLLGKRDVHDRERDLEEVEWPVLFEAPGPEGVADPCAEAEPVRIAERRVVGEAEALERGEIAVRINSQVVIALAAHGPGERLELTLLLVEAGLVLGGRVAPVQADFHPGGGDRLDYPRAQALVDLRGRSV